LKVNGSVDNTAVVSFGRFPVQIWTWKPTASLILYGLYVTWYNRCTDKDRLSFHSTPCRSYWGLR